MQESLWIFLAFPCVTISGINVAMKLDKAFRLLFSFVLLSYCIASSAVGAISGRDLLAEKSVEVKPGKKGTVVVFMSAKCPCSNNHVGIIKKLADEYKDFSFVVVHSNANESADLSKSYFQTVAFSFPVIQDGDGKLADEFKALKTPHAFLIGPDGKILYKGGVTSSSLGEGADRQFLRDALADVNEGRAVRVTDARTIGCIISRGGKHAP